jgi:hypothetical protein
MSGPYGLMALFNTPEALLEAAKRARAAGYREMEAFTPFPVEGLATVLAVERNAVPLLTLLGGLTGGISAFGMQWWSACLAYPYNVGGRPRFSWPAFIPITFEMTVLFAASAAFIGMFWLNGLPAFYNPVFAAPKFTLATRNGFFLCVRSSDPHYDAAATRAFLLGLAAREVDEFNA